MLKQRLLTAAILLPLFVWAVLSMPLMPFAMLLAGMVLLGAWEWGALMGLAEKTGVRAVYCIGIVAAMLLIWLNAQAWLQTVILLGSLWWLLAIPLVLGYPASTRFWQALPLQMLIGVFVLLPCWAALLYLKVHQGAQGYWLLLLFVVIWSADSGAYFAGRRFGKHKLAPSVSPGKTWEGLVGGLILALLLFVAYILLIGLSANSHWPGLLVLAVLTVMVSVLGDLFESMFKRHVGLKDSGRLLPGHGGVLDRIDSVTAAAPVFALGLTLIADTTAFPTY